MKMKNENARNAFMVISSNVLTIIIALFSGFVIPKQLSVADYGYYHIYCLYIVYSGFFHFGLVNGIYLKYGHLNVDELPEQRFRRYSRIMIGMQTIVMAVLAAVLFLASPGMEKGNLAAYAFLIINIPLVNIKWFYSSINQFTKRFVIDSMVTYLQNVLTLIMVVSIVWFHWYSYEALLLFTTGINLVCMLVVMGQNRRFLFGSAKRKVPLTGVRRKVLRENSDVRLLIRSGFFLMISEFVGVIILGVDSIFVQNLFTLDEFAMYSFAVSIISVIYTLISTVSNLIYPYLVRVDDEKYAEYYTLMSDVLSVVCVFSMLAFYAAKFIIEVWLDKYTNSIIIAAILFGTVIFRSLIMLVCGNYFKVLKMIKEYTKNNIFAITISVLLNIAAFVVFRKYEYIAIASLVSFIIWYLVTDFIFIRRMNIPKVGGIRRYASIALSLTVFYLLLNTATIPSFFIYMGSTLVICLICFWKQFKKLYEIVHGVSAKKKA